MQQIVTLTALDVPLTLVLDGVDPADVGQFVQSWARCSARVVSEIPLVGTVIRAGVREPGPQPVVVGDRPELIADTYRELADRLSGLVTRTAIDARKNTLLMFHAGGVADLGTGNVIAFVGPSGRGKTTASIALGRAFGYVTDETLGVDDDLGVLAYAKPLSLKQPPPERWKDQVGPVELGLSMPPFGALRLVGIVMLDRQSEHPVDAPPVLRPVSLASVIGEMVPQISYLTERARPLHRLRSTIDRCGGLQQVTYREADTLIGLFRGLFAEAEAEAEAERAELSRGEGVVLFEADYDDAIRDDEALIVLREGIVRVLAGIAPTLVELAATPVSLGDLVRGVVEVHGLPGEGEPDALIAAAVDELVANGLLRASAPRSS